jgi:KaiC/GvpD/RAD55 family RecA-like ATPase
MTITGTPGTGKNVFSIIFYGVGQYENYEDGDSSSADG